MLSPAQSTPLSSHRLSTTTHQISFCWSGTKVFATTDDGRTRILSYPDFVPVLQEPFGSEDDADAAPEFALSGHTSRCLSAELSPNGRVLATGGADAVISLWSTTTWLCQRTLTGMAGPVKSISQSSALILV